MLSAEIQAEILQLYFSQGLSFRQIARQLSIHRKTVGKVVERKRVQTKVEYPRKRRSILEPYYERVERLLQKAPERSCVNILQHLRDAGYTGGLSIIKTYVCTLRPACQKEAFFQLEFAKGEATQVDWGEFGDVFCNGTKVHVFVMVMCWSRMMYVEFTLKETLPTLLRCYERGLRFFGGRCREYWHDNMPTVVAERIGRLARFTTRFLAYVGFHGFSPVLCNKGAGNEKGRVEDGVKLVRYQFWPGRTFVDLDDINLQATQWRDRYANRRIHQKTGKVPELMHEQEQEALIALRPEPYDTDDLVSCTVSRFFRVRFESNTYSVPWTMVGKTITVRADDKMVRIFYGHKTVAVHNRCYRKGKDIKNPKHEEGLREIKAGASRTWQVDAIKSFGPNACRYLDLIQSTTRSLRTEINELLCLATVYGKQALEQTISELLGQGIVGVNYLERTLRLKDRDPIAPQPLQLSNERLSFTPPTPCLHSYDELLLEARSEQDPEET